MRKILLLCLTFALLLTALILAPLSGAKRNGQRVSPDQPQTGRAAPQKAGNARQTGGTPIVSKAIAFAKSPALRDMPADAPPTAEMAKKMGIELGEELEEHEVGEKNREAIRNIDTSVKPDLDGALQIFKPSRNRNAPQVLPTPSLVFDGNSNQDNANLFGFRLSPPDTEGDVGPNHYVQVINLTIRIFDKAGTPLIPARKFSSIFTALGAPCGAEDGGDPIALYDPMADRWLLSQFCFPFADPGPYFETIAISQTPDPTGAYYLYNFQVSGPPSNEFPDYPHFGVWPDGYYMTTNQFAQGVTFDGGGVFAFDRKKMLVGDPTASFIYFNRSLASFPEGQAGMLPADMDGVKPPPVGTPCPFAYFTATEFGDPADGMRIFDFHADFATPANSTFIERAESSAIPGGGIPVAPFNPLAPAGRDAVPQPPPASPTTARLDAISDRLMHRLQYINFGTYESLVVNNTVNVGTDQTLANYRAGVRYYQFRKNPGVAPWAPFEQATWAGPVADTSHRWMGSAAMNAHEDLAVGFSTSSLTVFPSIRYAARFAGDPPNGLAQGEQTLFTGTGVQTDTGSRWGDYSALQVDPVDDCTFWFTTETYTAASQATSGVGWLTKIAKFNLGTACVPFQKGTISGQITNCNTGLPVAGAIVKTSDGFLTTTDAGGNYTLPKMAPGSYTVSATKAGFSTATANSVAVTNGNTTTQNLCIAPIVIITSAGSAIVSAGGNGALDPGETVTVSLSLQNTGGAGACTTNLTGTLAATGGVTSPSGPQNYGATCAGDPPVARNFTFTVNPSLACGATVTLTLNVQDGAATYGPFTYTFVTGQTGVPAITSYTGPPVAIPDNNPAGINIPVVVSGITGLIGDFNFKVDGSACNATIGGTTNGIDHTWIGDIVIKVTSPGGTTVAVFDRPGVPASTVGFNRNNICQMLLDDDGGFPSIETGADIEPVTGNFSPNNPMSAFDGQNPNGTWTINVSDNAGIDTGSVRAFSLIISNRSCDPVGPPPGALAFSAPTYSIGEAGASATITVNRTGGSAGTVGATVATSNGSATGGAACGGAVDYQNVNTTVSLANGVTSTSFNVPICDDATSESNETVNLTISAPTGGATIGAQNTAVLTITDNDGVACTGITCPANITTTNDVNQCGKVVTYPAPTPVGTCGTINCSPASGSFFPKGTTTVNCTSTAGPTCSFTVTVNDTQPPTITCPANVTQAAPPGQNSAVVNYPAPTASDNCTTVTTNCVPASGSTFNAGTTPVTCTATDSSGNTATCQFNVTVTLASPRYWTSVGATATADEDSLSKVSFDDFAAQLKDGVVGTVTVRYNITAVKGISAFCPATTSVVNVRFRNSDNSGIHAQVKFEIHRTHVLNGGNDNIFSFNSNGLGAGAGFTSASLAPNIDFDFSNYVYWIEGTIFRDQTTQFADLGDITIYENAGTPCP